MSPQDLAAMEHKLEEHILESRLETVELDKKVTDIVDALRTNTMKMNEVFDLYQNLLGALKVLSAIERACVWLAKLAVAGGLVWGFWKFIVIEAVLSYTRGGK